MDMFLGDWWSSRRKKNKEVILYKTTIFKINERKYFECGINFIKA